MDTLKISSQTKSYCSFCKKEVVVKPGPKGPTGIVGLYCSICGGKTLG